MDRPINGSSFIWSLPYENLTQLQPYQGPKHHRDGLSLIHQALNISSRLVNSRQAPISYVRYDSFNIRIPDLRNRVEARTQ